MRHQRPAASDNFSRERGSWKKNWKGRLPVALIFPNNYGVGMSNLGFQLVYDLINQHPELVCERVFLPAKKEKPLSVESSRRLADFPVIFGSISFEQDIPALVKILLAAGIEPLAQKRSLDNNISPGNPLIVVGGVSCFINPEPVASFADLLVVGEAEPVLPDIVGRLLVELDRGKEKFLREIAIEVPGCYVPRYYHFFYNDNEELTGIEADPEIPARVTRLGVEGSTVSAHSKILSPAAEFSDLYMVELGRGCSRGCRFCAAGFVYRPPRLWSSEAILAAVNERPEGVDRIGLLGMEMVRPGELQVVAERLLGDCCHLSFSSLRADVISDSLLHLLAKSGLKSVAIAPDGGSERLRRVINKGITGEDVCDSAERLVRAGIFNLKLYFMIGLPTEMDEDLDELVELVKSVREIMDVPGRQRGRLSTLTLSINPFVPKAWTPFQFHSFAQVKELKRKLKYLQAKLKDVSNLKIMGEKPDNALMQATLARGDRRMAPAIIEYAEEGGNWSQVLKRNGIIPDHVLGSRGRYDVLPWEVIDHGINRDYLWAEYQKGLAGRQSDPCDTSICRRCGICG